MNFTRRRAVDQAILDLARDHRTPFYIYDLEILRHSFATLRTALPSPVEILYSMKANPHPVILNALRELGAGIDVGSETELRIALEAGFSPKNISFVGPGKTAAELIQAIQAEVLCIVVESSEELRQIEILARQLNRPANVCIRVNPLGYKNHMGQAVSGLPSQFGIDEEQLDEVLLIHAGQSFVRLIGLHFYISSHFFRVDSLADNFTNFLTLAADFQRRLRYPLNLVNLGGGFGLPYFAGESELDMAELRRQLQPLFASRRQDFPAVKFYVESGRFIVGRCGTFVTKVLYRKQSRERVYLVCDGGFAHHMSASGAGQVIRKNFPISVLGAGAPDSPTEIVTFAGPSCYSVDLLAENIALPVSKVGDLICVENSGAYGLTFSPTDFLLPTPAGEFFC